MTQPIQIRISSQRKVSAFRARQRDEDAAAARDADRARERQTMFTYAPGTTRVPEGSAAPVYQRSHTITAEIEVPDGGASGVLIANGGSSAGYTLYLEDGVPVYEFNFFGREHYRVAGVAPLEPGAHRVTMAYEQAPFEAGKDVTGGIATLSVNGTEIGSGEIAQVVPARYSATETMDIGMDLGATVSPAYKEAAPFAFTGTIKQVSVELR